MSFPFACIPNSMCHYVPRFSLFFFTFSFINTYICHHLFCAPLFFPLSFFFCFQADPDPLSIYHPMTEETSATMGTLMEGFFDGIDVVVEAMAFTSATVQGALAETPISLAKFGPIEECAQTKRVGESASIPTKIPTPQKGVTPATASQIEGTSPATPPIISTNNPFVTLS